MTYPPSSLASDKIDVTASPTDHPGHHNSLASAVNDIVAELGSGPKGAAASLTARLAALDITVAGAQPLDSDLTAIAALATTSFGRALLTLADAAALRTAAALGTAATQNAGTAGGVATLDGGGKVPQAQMPAVALTDFLGAVASQAAMLALTGQRGDWCTRTDRGTDWQLVADDPTVLGNWREHVYPASPVSSVNGRTGAVTGLAEATDVTTEASARAAADGLLLVKASNLSDLASAATARTNLGLGTAATHPVGDFAQVASNLSDLASASTARTNLGLGTAATHAIGEFVLVPTVVSKTSAYTAVYGDVVLADATSAVFTVTLPAAATGKAVITVKKVDSSANPVTVTPAAGTVDGAASYVIGQQYVSVDLVTDGTNWFLI